MATENPRFRTWIPVVSQIAVIYFLVFSFIFGSLATDYSEFPLNLFEQSIAQLFCCFYGSHNANAAAFCYSVGITTVGGDITCTICIKDTFKYFDELFPDKT